MRLRTSSLKASRAGLAGGLLGDAQQQALCTPARGQTVFGAGVASIREGPSLYTWPPGACAGMPFRPGPSLQVAAPVT